MDILLLGITVVSLVVALVMSVAAWRVMRDDKKRSAARVAALSLAADTVADDKPSVFTPNAAAKTGLSPQEYLALREEQFASSQEPLASLESFSSQDVAVAPTAPAKAPWSAPGIVPASAATAPLRMPPPIVAAELPLNQPAARVEAARISEPAISHASGFLGAADVPREAGSRQKMLAFAAVFLFTLLAGGLAWMMSSPEGTSATAVGPNAPLELMSLSHQRENSKLSVSGLVRNPAAGEPIQKLSAVVFLFDRTGTFVTSSRANVDFLKLGAGDESPFVVSLDAPPTVARYRVSFRTDDGVVPHVDRRVSSQESTVKSQVISRQ